MTTLELFSNIDGPLTLQPLHHNQPMTKFPG